MTDPLDLDAIQKLAEAAHDGRPWYPATVLVENEYPVADAEFIAATGPDVILRLVQELRDARAEAADAWDEGFQAGWEECDKPGGFVNDLHDAVTPNPYRSADDRA